MALAAVLIAAIGTTLLVGSIVACIVILWGLRSSARRHAEALEKLVKLLIQGRQERPRLGFAVRREDPAPEPPQSGPGVIRPWA